MLDLIRNIFGSKSYPLNKITISKGRLLKNYQLLSNLKDQTAVAPVLKSNAYGHGTMLVGKILDQVGAPFFCVDSLFEAYQLKKVRVKTPILIMGYSDPKSLSSKKLPFNYTVFDLDFARALNVYQPGSEIHVFVGTGMSREGVPLKQLSMFLSKLKEFKNLKVVGIMSHFSSAEEPSKLQTQNQLQNFKQAKQIALEYFPTSLKWFHLGGSMALINSLSDGVCNAVRVGKALYGIGSGGVTEPTLNLKTKIVQIKKINKGAKVGYNETFIAAKNMTIAILPIGYYDGVDRRLSNKGVFQVDGEWTKIIGLVSMNVTTIDITKVINPYVGLEVTVFSEDNSLSNSIENAAKICQTIPLDLLVHLNPYIRREVVE